MVKKLLIFSIKIYTTVLSTFLHQLLGVSVGCRYSETCSRYAGRVIEEYGILCGLRLSMKRLASCHPFAK
ncbi:MAG: membrane protein insertion efficiency factor YidD [Candidatus Levybacteria bacterium]|nr:membrane protein insertion efficiency factor YidD [Candidatus Levybacteria bacterium]